MKSTLIGVTYLLHFDSPIGHSRHYLGWTVDLEARLECHRSGYRDKCVLTHEAMRRGIGFVLATTWPGVLITHEKRLKRQRNGPRLCPICNPRSPVVNGSSGVYYALEAHRIGELTAGEDPPTSV